MPAGLVSVLSLLSAVRYTYRYISWWNFFFKLIVTIN
jgi:hypothetical protein